jgi:hypothetical protein
MLYRTRQYIAWVTNQGCIVVELHKMSPCMYLMLQKSGLLWEMESDEMIMIENDKGRIKRHRVFQLI